VPADHRGRLDEEKLGPPVAPDSAQPGPQESIRLGEFRSLHRALQNPDWMAECENLQLQGHAAPERIGRETKSAGKSGPKGNPRKNAKSQVINEFGIDENHSSGPIFFGRPNLRTMRGRTAPRRVINMTRSEVVLQSQLNVASTL
jgi:hypothetical protein